jgi:sarcosine oxidase
VLRARELWVALQEETGVRIFEPVGFAWLARRTDGFEAASRPVLDRLGVRNEWRAPEDARDVLPGLTPDGLAGVLWEPDAGVLWARTATRLLVEDGVRLGVRVATDAPVAAQPPEADVVVWACGAWLPQLFPDVVDVEVWRREEVFLGGDGAWTGAPGFVEYDAGFYGHGDLGGLGVKLGGDVNVERVDPDTVDRLPARERADEVRAYLSERFPTLAGAPQLGGRVCQYDLSADTHFIVDRHPERAHWWLVGGGSGHGFKHGPALGEYVADCVEGRRERESFHALGRRGGDAGLRTGTL